MKFHATTDEGVTITRDVTLLADPGAKLTRGTNGAILQVNNASIVEINDLLISDSRTGADPGIATTGQSQLTLKHVTVSLAKGNGITCMGKSLTIIGSTIADNGAAGIDCTGTSVVVSSSTFTGNDRGGIALNAGTFDITNNFIYRNGDGASSVGGVSIATATGLTNQFDFNTVVDNHARDSMLVAGGVLCDVVFVAKNNLIVHNDLNGDTTKVTANKVGQCSYLTSLIAEPIAPLNFASPTNPPYDYHLTAGSSAIGAAATDPTVTVDFDGDARPQGATSDQGADELK